MNKDPSKFYGRYGGCFVPELLVEPLAELKRSYEAFLGDAACMEELAQELARYAGRPTVLTLVPRFSEAIGGPRIVLKREDLLHTGSHKLNNALGQCLLAKYQGKTRIIAETGAGQHGVAIATTCARLGLECVVYMGAVDVARQHANVQRMKLLGATVIAVDKGSKTLKDAINEALRDWAESYEQSHYCLGSALGPDPFPGLVRAFQSVIGIEVKKQVEELCQRKPDMIVACVGGGSNAIGIFAPFIDDPDVKLIGVEAGGVGMEPGQHAARF
ncbi:MAG: tryptophan synthase subunit beta, partial [Chlamydiia bacterium]|nr:tryptophan synthase subunit beta [Chlamydiia bacterium]